MLNIIIVQICEECGLVHESRGEGSERFVQVEKNVEIFPRPQPVSVEEPHHKKAGTMYVWLAVQLNEVLGYKYL